MSDISKDPIVRWEEAVDNQMRLGKTQAAAVKVLARRYPRLHAEYLRVFNARHQPDRAANARAQRELDRRFGKQEGPADAQ